MSYGAKPIKKTKELEKRCVRLKNRNDDIK